MSGGPLLDLLPDLILNRGEVQRIGQYPAGSSTTTDIWEGTYLGKVKVALRTIRALKSDQKTLQARHIHTVATLPSVSYHSSDSSERLISGPRFRNLIGANAFYPSLVFVLTMGPTRELVLVVCHCSLA